MRLNPIPVTYHTSSLHWAKKKQKTFTWSCALSA